MAETLFTPENVRLLSRMTDELMDKFRQSVISRLTPEADFDLTLVDLLAGPSKTALDLILLADRPLTAPALPVCEDLVAMARLARSLLDSASGIEQVFGVSDISNETDDGTSGD